MNRRHAVQLLGLAPATAQSLPQRYIRFRNGNRISWALVEGDNAVPLSAAPYLNAKPLGAKRKLNGLPLLAPADPPKVFAVGLNYRSHLGNRRPPSEPEIFYKPPTCIIGPGSPILIPPGAKNVHYEGELILVLGKGGRNLSREQAQAAIFGAACGNDVSERDWQNGPQKDLQWWRAKGSDTFGPLGPYLVSHVNYANLLLQTRLNGQVVQKQSTSDLLFDCPSIVSYISRFVSLEVGDVIYTGTPGSTKKMSPGDTVEVLIESLGTLKNPVQAA